MENRIAKIISSYPSGKQKYLDFYSRYFENLNPKVLLEIGVFKGDSLRTWKEVFPQCKVHGIDIDTKTLTWSPELSIFIGNQKDTSFIDSVLSKIGFPDIVIDDGGHKRSEQITSLSYIFPKLWPDSIYIIEDLQVSESKPWNDSEISAIDYLKSLIGPNGRPVKLNYRTLTFESSICMLVK